jgi:hypothetical protein
MLFGEKLYYELKGIKTIEEGIARIKEKYDYYNHIISERKLENGIDERSGYVYFKNDGNSYVQTISEYKRNKEIEDIFYYTLNTVNNLEESFKTDKKVIEIEDILDKINCVDTDGYTNTALDNYEVFLRTRTKSLDYENSVINNIGPYENYMLYLVKTYRVNIVKNQEIIMSDGKKFITDDHNFFYYEKSPDNRIFIGDIGAFLKWTILENIVEYYSFKELIEDGSDICAIYELENGFIGGSHRGRMKFIVGNTIKYNDDLIILTNGYIEDCKEYKEDEKKIQEIRDLFVNGELHIKDKEIAKKLAIRATDALS